MGERDYGLDEQSGGEGAKRLKILNFPVDYFIVTARYNKFYLDAHFK